MYNMDWYVLTVCCVWVGLLVRIEAKGKLAIVNGSQHTLHI